MDVLYSCRCCLRRPPEKALTTPDTHLGQTETYADMLKQCFDIQLSMGILGSCGICAACVGRLRDASDFKLQVQRSQAELMKASLATVKVEVSVEVELAEDSVGGDSIYDVLHEELIPKSEVVSEEETGQGLDEDPLVKPGTYAMSNDLAGDRASGNQVGARRRSKVKQEAASGKPEAVSGKPEHLLVEATCRVGRFIRTLRTNATQHSNKDKSTARYQCHDCGRRFTKKTPLKQHIHKLHTGETHKCNYCHYNFKHKSILLEHERSHTGERPFQCSLCDYKSRQNSNLKIHMMIHTGQKPISCDQCNYKCRRVCELRRHTMIHTGEKPFECKYCDYKSNDRMNIRNHEMSHTGEKPFECMFCEHRCRRKRDLKIHQLIHTNEKPLKCSLCDYSCRHRLSLKAHLKAKHPDENP